MARGAVFPFVRPGTIERTEEMFRKITIPFITGAFEGAYTYKMHWQGAQNFFYGNLVMITFEIELD